MLIRLGHKGSLVKIAAPTETGTTDLTTRFSLRIDGATAVLFWWVPVTIVAKESVFRVLPFVHR